MFGEIDINIENTQIKKTRRKRGSRVAVNSNKQNELVQAEIKWKKLLQNEINTRFEVSNASFFEE